MHVAIRRCQLAPTLADELLRRVNEGFISVIKDAPGFLGYYALDDEERPGRFGEHLREPSGGRRIE
jgi:hypothetical protein